MQLREGFFCKVYFRIYTVTWSLDYNVFFRIYTDTWSLDYNVLFRIYAVTWNAWFRITARRRLHFTSRWVTILINPIHACFLWSVTRVLYKLELTVLHVFHLVCNNLCYSYFIQFETPFFTICIPSFVSVQQHERDPGEPGRHIQSNGTVTSRHHMFIGIINNDRKGRLFVICMQSDLCGLPACSYVQFES